MFDCSARDFSGLTIVHAVFFYGFWLVDVCPEGAEGEFDVEEEFTKAPCCAEDGGTRASEAAVQKEASSSCKLRWSNRESSWRHYHWSLD